MVLSQVDIRKEVEAGSIVFDPPLEEKQWGKASVDLRLGYQITKFGESKGLKISVADGLGTVGQSGLWKTKELKPKDELGKRETFTLDPGEFVLGMTLEKVTIPNHLIASVEGRSTYARIGLSMHQTAPWIQPGWTGHITLEIMNHGPHYVDLTPEVDRPCQLTFFRLTNTLPDDLAYGARDTDLYQDQTHPLKHNG